MTTKIYGPWVKWDGGECPVPDDTRVEVKCRSGKVLEPHLAYRYSWSHIDSNSDIVEYHTVTEQPNLEAAEFAARKRVHRDPASKAADVRGRDANDGGAAKRYVVLGP